MPVPKRKKSKARTRQRRAHQSLAPLNLVACPKCQAKVLPHRMCTECGYYKGREVVRTVQA